MNSKPDTVRSVSPFFSFPENDRDGRELIDFCKWKLYVKVTFCPFLSSILNCKIEIAC